MKKLKLVGAIIAGILLVFYIIYLFVLPNVIKLDFAKDMAKSIAKEQAGVDLKLGNIKLLTGFPLNAGVEVRDVELTCAYGAKALQLEKATAKVSLFPLIFKKIHIINISADDVVASSDISKDGKLSLESCFVFPETTSQDAPAEASMDFKIDDKLPVVVLDDIIFNLKDLETSNVLALKIDSLILDRAVLNKHFRVNTQGKILLNEAENVKFDIKADSFMPDFASSEVAEDTHQAEYINFIKEFAKYNLLADIKSDLKISQKDKDILLNGYANIDALSFKIDAKQLPESYLHTNFANKKVDVDSKIYVSEQENFALTALLNNTKNINLEAVFTTDKISFVNIQKLAIAVLDSLNIKNDFSALKTGGYIVSNLKLKTDSQKFESSGNFKIADGEVISAKDGLFVKQIQSNIDLENNALKINKTSALVNDALFNVSGSINADAVADITVSSEKLPLAKLASAFLTGDLKKNYEIKNGILDLKLLLKGKLDSIKPSADVVLTSLEVIDKINKIILSNSCTNVKIDTDGKTFSGNVNAKGSKINFSDLKLVASIPSLAADVAPDKISINKSDIIINSSKISLQGVIKDYMKLPDIDISADGGIVSNDIKNLLPKDIASISFAKGTLPLKLQIKGTDKLSILAQILANQDNNFSVIKVDKLQNHTSIVNADIVMAGSTIIINDAGVYAAKVSSLSDNLANNIAGGSEVVSVAGDILNGTTLKGVKVNANNTLGLDVMNIKMNTKGNLALDGSINNPTIKGSINLSNINAPDYLIKGQMVNLNLAQSGLNADIFGLDLNGSSVDIKAQGSSSFAMPYVISSLDVNSTGIDLDKVLEITAKIPQGASGGQSSSQNVSNAPMVPVTINKGTAKLGEFKVGTLSASNVISDFTLVKDLLKLKNLKGTAYKGSLKGEIDYNLKTLAMNAKLQGENMDANPAVTALLAIKDQVMGTLKFDADIYMKGAEMNEQLKSLKGKANFEVNNGQLGSLGKFETYLKAANILSSKILETSINTIISTILPYNSGQISYAKGDLTFGNGNVNFAPINTSGKEMALNVTGSLNMLNYNGNIKILGRLNQEMVDVLGPVGNISVDKVLSYIPKVGTTASSLFKAFNAQATEKDLANIPALTPAVTSKTFKVIINGNTMSTSAVKSFQWLATEEVLNSTESSIKKQFTIPTTKEELVEQVKTNLQKNIQHQTQKKLDEVIDKNETLKTIKGFGEMFLNKDAQPVESVPNE